MGLPIFKIKKKPYFESLVIFSSNYALYADMSNRFHKTLANMGHLTYRYSVDEAFVELPDGLDYHKIGAEISERIRRHVGLPVTVGIGPSKVLAKLSGHFAKRSQEPSFCFEKGQPIDKYLHYTPVSELWGVGRRWAKKCNALGIHSAKDLRDTPSETLQAKFNKHMVQMQWELKGTPCIGFSKEDPKSILSSRSFVPDIHDLDTLLSATGYLAKTAILKLQKHKQQSGLLTVFLKSNRFKTPYYSNSHSMALAVPSDQFHILIPQLKSMMRSLYRNDFSYKRAGILLQELGPNTQVPLPIFQSPKENKLEDAIQAIQAKHGKNLMKWSSDLLYEDFKFKFN